MSVETGLDPEKALVEPSEEMKQRIQMQEISELTVDGDKGVMKLPVKPDGINTTEESEKYTINLEHPVEGDIKFHLEKPLTGWSTRYNLVELMEEWYGMNTTSPYALQRYKLYVRYRPDARDNPYGPHDWHLVDPRKYEPRRMSRKRRLKWRIDNRLRAAYEDTLFPWVFIFASVSLIAQASTLISLPWLLNIPLAFVMTFIAVVVGEALFGGDGS